MEVRVGAFTDTYLPTVNGVSYTVKTWRQRWNGNGGDMPVIYPAADGYEPDRGEHPVHSLPFPFYQGYRIGVPTLPDDLPEFDVMHAHTPFSLGLAALRLSRRQERPFVASYHTPTAQYADYLSSIQPFKAAVSSVCDRYEHWFLERADMIIAPSRTTADHLEGDLDVSTPIRVISNGVDLSRFDVTEGGDFRDRMDLPAGPLIGYTGRHGYEKELRELIDAVAAGPGDWTLAIAGEGPATGDLKAHAATSGVDARFLGFLDRDELPGFYGSLDVFAFPSPVETQGLVALESMACGTPVVGVNAGALGETIEDGTTGYHYPAGDVAAFTEAITQALRERDRLAENCLARRDHLSVERSIAELKDAYETIVP